jgi:hypothetical protein
MKEPFAAAAEPLRWRRSLKGALATFGNWFNVVRLVGEIVVARIMPHSFIL